MKPRGKSWNRLPGDALLGLKSVSSEGIGPEGMIWPLKVGAWVHAEKWTATNKYWDGLYYLPWGKGSYSLLNWRRGSVWLVLAVHKPLVDMEIGAKCKRCRIVHIGTRRSATAFLARYAPDPACIVGYGENAYRGRSRTSGDYEHAHVKQDESKALAKGWRAHALASGDESGARATGYQSHAVVAGSSSCALAEGTAGHACALADDGCAAAPGHYGVAVAVHGGWASAGQEGCILLATWNGHTKRMICKALHVGKEAKSGYWYRLRPDGTIEESKDPPGIWAWKRRNP